MYLDPDSGADQNYPGECVVAYEGKNAKPQDIIFSGKPTPDMEPLDEEAEKITEATKSEWIHPIDTLSPTGGNYSETLLAVLTKQLDEAARKSGTVIAGAVNEDAFRKMQDDMKALMDSNAKLQAQLALKPGTVGSRG
jgi:hypothetical protein